MAEHVLVRLSANIQRSLDSEYLLNERSIIGKFIDLGSCKVPTCSLQSTLSACWVLFDIYMESAMDAKQLPVTSAIDILSGDLKFFHLTECPQSFKCEGVKK